MKTYIVKNQAIVATVNTDLKVFTVVNFSAHRCVESIDANREFNLVNAQIGRIARGAKWEKMEQSGFAYIPYAELIVDNAKNCTPAFYIQG